MEGFLGPELTKRLDGIKTEIKAFGENMLGRNVVSSIHIFGSLVYKNGEQFMDTSDVDLAVTLLETDHSNALNRVRQINLLKESKRDLELKLMRILQASGLTPIVSLIPLTSIEIECDIHKDLHRPFFGENIFQDAITKEIFENLPNAGTLDPPRYGKNGIAFAQKTRNLFLAEAPNSTLTLQDFSGEDPLPKALMRASAQTARYVGETEETGAEFDLKEGLDYLANLLYSKRTDDQAYRKLSDKISNRRGARGYKEPLSPDDQLMLAEILYDQCIGHNHHSPKTSSPKPQAKKAKKRASRKAALSDSPAPPQVDEQSCPKTTTTVASGEQKHGTAVPSKIVLPQDAKHVELQSIATAEKTSRFNGWPSVAALDEQQLIAVKSDLPLPERTSTAFFSERFQKAFSGFRAEKWISDQAEIKARLLALLTQPLRFENSTPIWWWRGGNLPIERFFHIQDSEFLMNDEELDIEKIAVFPNTFYQRNFVYIQCKPMTPTGAYEDLDPLARFNNHNSYDYEEFGVFENKVLTRSEYDDGRYYEEGSGMVDITGKSALRIRYTSPYNFIIAPNGSPINNPSFDHILEKMMNKALRGNERDIMGEVSKMVDSLPIRTEH